MAAIAIRYTLWLRRKSPIPDGGSIDPSGFSARRRRMPTTYNTRISLACQKTKTPDKLWEKIVGRNHRDEID
jgi:hypothetical protein